jgi:hypothetical protein|tara:strand:- start:511 stop:669 length:159 start_codon:yes stop_codon:yes gene_type:complete
MSGLLRLNFVIIQVSTHIAIPSPKWLQIEKFQVFSNPSVELIRMANSRELGV